MYNGKAPLLSSAFINQAMEDYMEDSLAMVTGNAIYEQMLYKLDVKKMDPHSGKKWAYTFEVAMPQGPGGYNEFKEEMWKGMMTPGLMGNMIPDAETYTIGTKFQFASIGRSLADQLMDDKNFFEAIKKAHFGEGIKAQQDEQIKQAIFNASTKLYAGDATTEDEITSISTHGLKFADLTAAVIALESEEVQLIDNMKRVSDAFYSKVADVDGTFGTEATGTISSNFNVIDYKSLAEAQAEFENGTAYRTYEWFTPRFTVNMNEMADHYITKDIGDNDISLSKPEYTSLFTGSANEGNGQNILVLVTREGMRQLHADDDFKAAIQTGAVLEPGISGKYNQFTNNKKVINVQGMLIVDMGVKDGLYGTVASQGTRAELAKNAAATPVQLHAALIATPGYNFITTAPEFGRRVSTKGLNQTDSLDRLGLQEFMYALWTFDIVIETPTAFTTLIYAGKE